MIAAMKAALILLLPLLAFATAVQADDAAHAPAPVVSGGLDGTYVYDDAAPGPERSEAEEQAATLACDGGVSARVGTPAFNACMKQRDWVFSNFQSAHCRVTDPTGTTLNLRAAPAGTILGPAAPNGAIVAIVDSAYDAKQRQWARIARPNGTTLGWVFQNYLVCF